MIGAEDAPAAVGCDRRAETGRREVACVLWRDGRVRDTVSPGRANDPDVATWIALARLTVGAELPFLVLTTDGLAAFRRPSGHAEPC